MLNPISIQPQYGHLLSQVNLERKSPPLYALKDKKGQVGILHKILFH